MLQKVSIKEKRLWVVTRRNLSKTADSTQKWLCMPLVPIFVHHYSTIRIYSCFLLKFVLVQPKRRFSTLLKTCSFFNITSLHRCLFLKRDMWCILQTIYYHHCAFSIRWFFSNRYHFRKQFIWQTAIMTRMTRIR